MRSFAEAASGGGSKRRRQQAAEAASGGRGEGGKGGGFGGFAEAADAAASEDSRKLRCPIYPRLLECFAMISVCQIQPGRRIPVARGGRGVSNDPCLGAAFLLEIAMGSCRSCIGASFLIAPPRTRHFLR